MAQRLRISQGGQVSVPAAVRKRWRTSTVIAEDHGDRLVIKPAPDDPIAAAAGVFADRMRGMSIEEALRLEREEEAELEDRRYGRP